MQNNEINIDPREIAHYEALAKTWWDRTGPFWPLHKLNELRRDYLLVHLADAFGRDPASRAPFEGLSMLDVGCGGGILSESMARLGASVHGVDVTAKNIEVARTHARECGLDIDYEHVQVGELVRREAIYDVVLNMEVVEHVPDRRAFLGECGRLVRPGGIMSVATINRTFKAWLFAIVGAEYVLNWLPRGTHRFGRLVKPREVVAALGPLGFDVMHQTGVRVNPFNRRFSLTERMSVNYMLITKRRQKTNN